VLACVLKDAVKFPAHLQEEKIEAGLLSGIYKKGKFRPRSYNCMEALVFCENEKVHATRFFHRRFKCMWLDAVINVHTDARKSLNLDKKFPGLECPGKRPGPGKSW